MDELLDYGHLIWKSNLQIMAAITQLQERPPSLDTRRTWFQDPIKFEDALGYVIPIPSEYTWSVRCFLSNYPITPAPQLTVKFQKVHAIIADQFSTGPGSGKVRAGEYRLFDPNNSAFGLPDRLIPGMCITMAFVVGRYGFLTRCPRNGCTSIDIEPGRSGRKTW